MAITKMTDDLNIIQALADLPNDTDGLTPAQLKAKYDEAANLLKTYLNNTLTVELESTTDGSSGADKIGATALNELSGETVQAILEYLKTQIDGVTLGEIPDDSLTNVKLNTDIKIGSLASLTTTDKGSVIGAINEINSEIVTVAEANKILKLDANSKLPASITGDADTLDLYHATDFMKNKSYGYAEYVDSIPFQTSLVKSIPIGSGKKYGTLTITQQKTNVVDKGGNGILVCFSDNPDTTLMVGQSLAGWVAGGAVSKRYLGYVSLDYILAGSNIDGFGYIVTGGQYIRVNNISINGSNLEIEFFNNHDSSSQTLYTRIDWEVW